jgi:pectin methylesterase-like acyl-CoA thioesterase
MKKFNLLLILFFLGFFNQNIEASGNEKSVTPENILDVLATASDGDVLILDGGIYSMDIPFPEGKIITLKNADPTSLNVELTGSVTVNEASNNGGLIFNGLTIAPVSDYFISGTIGDISILEFSNCVIQNVNRCLLRINKNESTIGALRFNNTLIKDCGSKGYNFMWVQVKVGEVAVTNSTLYNYIGGESFFSRHSANANADFVFSFLMENCTVYKWSKGSGYALCKTDATFSEASTFTFRNNIINMPGLAAQEPKLVTATGGHLLAENNLVVDYGSYNLSNPLSSSVTDHTLASLDLSELSFPDPDNGNFIVYSTSSLASAGKDGGVIGDPRWLTEVTEMYTLTTGLAAGVDDAAGTVAGPSGEMAANIEVTLTAERNFGYRFVKWVDTDGNTLSENPSYSFEMDGDKSVLVHFEAVNVYALDLSILGAGEYGEVLISAPGKDGEYLLYEENASIELTAVSNAIILFSDWDGVDTNPVKRITFNNDVSVSANFYTESYIGGWEFVGGGNQSRPADYYTGVDINPVFSMHTSTDNSVYQSWWNREEMGRSAAFIWKTRTSAEQYYYFQAQFSTIGFADITVQYALMSKYYGNSEWLLQYSTDGLEFTEVGRSTINGSDFTEDVIAIPGSGGHEQVTLRWVPDVSSPVLGNIADVDGTGITDVFILADAIHIEDHDAPEMVSTIPLDNAVNVSANGKVVITFNEKVVAGTSDWSLSHAEIHEVIFTDRKVAFSYGALDYNKTYTLTIPAGAITDLSGNAFEGVSLSFLTMERPAVVKKGFDFVVDPNATPVAGQVGNTIASAFEAVPNNQLVRFHILVKDGLYNEIVELPSSKSNVSLIGESRDGVIITGSPSGISNPVVRIASNNFYCENVTFQNTLGLTNGVGVAITTGGEKTVYKNVRMLGGQDTHVTSGTRHYFENSAIHGTVDFICGEGDVFFENCVLFLEERGSANVIVAAATYASQQYGYVFSNCTIDGSAMSNDGAFSLGRPWKNAPRAVFLNTTMKLLPLSKGWTDMGALAPALYAEFGSVNQHGVALDLSQRTNTFQRDGIIYAGDYSPVLTAEQAEVYTIENVLGGNDGWQPKLVSETVAAPAISLNKASLSWDEVDFAMCYLILRNGEIIDWTSENNYEVSVSGNYSVKAASEFGALSTNSNVSVVELTTGIEHRGISSSLAVFGLDKGIRVMGITQATTVSVFSLAGSLVKLEHLRSDALISVKEGIYVVKAANRLNVNTYKVIVN